MTSRTPCGSVGVRPSMVGDDGSGYWGGCEPQPSTGYLRGGEAELRANACELQVRQRSFRSSGKTRRAFSVNVIEA
jgi:hypothetical protein